MSRFNALTVFKLENPHAVTADKLKQYAFQPAPSGEPKAWGWVSMEDLTDTEWKRSVPEIGEFMAFALRVDTRNVAAPVLKLHLQEALLREQAKIEAEGGKFVSRGRKKELKEQITSKLLSRVEPSPKLIDIAADTSKGLVYVGSATQGVLDIFEEYFDRSFGEKPLPLPYALLSGDAGEPETFEATGRAMRWIYDQNQSVAYGGKTYSVHIGDAVAISLAGTGEPLSVICKGEMESANAALEQGLTIVKLHIQIEEDGFPAVTSFTWNRDFSFSGLKLPAAEKDDDNPDGVFLEKMYLLDRVVSVMGILLTR